MKVNSTLIASVQGSTTGGQELEIPEALLLTAQLPLPLSGIQLAANVELRNVPNSVHIFRGVNQAINTAAQTLTLATLDRGIYQIKGLLFAAFFGFTPNSADPFGAVLQLAAPGGAAAITIALTPLADAAAAGILNQPIPFDYTYQIMQSGWVLQMSTFHATGAAQTIGAQISVQVNRML